MLSPTVRLHHEPLMLGAAEDLDAARRQSWLLPDSTEIDGMPASVPPQRAMGGDISSDEACRSIHEASEQSRSRSYEQKSALDGAGRGPGDAPLSRPRGTCRRSVRDQLPSTGQLHWRPRRGCSDVPRRETPRGDSDGVGRQPNRGNRDCKEPEGEDCLREHAAQRECSSRNAASLDPTRFLSAALRSP